MHSKKLPKINFIGNKEKIANWICNNFPKKTKTVFDAFSGGGSVSYEAKKKGKKVISNDVLKINYYQIEKYDLKLLFRLDTILIY